MINNIKNKLISLDNKTIHFEKEENASLSISNNYIFKIETLYCRLEVSYIPEDRILYTHRCENLRS
jgi:hypothetical protein